MKQSKESKAQTEKLPDPLIDLHVAAEHYVDGMRRARAVGITEERNRIKHLLRSDFGRDWIWNRWKGDTQLYDLLEELIDLSQKNNAITSQVYRLNRVLDIESEIE
jgi:hypothetical protein